MFVHALCAAPARRFHVAHAGHEAVLPARHPVPLSLIGALVDAAPGPERSEIFSRWLESRGGERRPRSPQSERVAAAAMSLLDAPDVPIEDLARLHGLSRRQLERDFQRLLGMAPRGYARLVRFQRAARAIAGGMALAHVAADCGFADQAHMTRAFGEIAGITPRRLRDGAAQRSLFAHRPTMLPARMPAI